MYELKEKRNNLWNLFFSHTNTFYWLETIINFNQLLKHKLFYRNSFLHHEKK